MPPAGFKFLTLETKSGTLFFVIIMRKGGAMYTLVNWVFPRLVLMGMLALFSLCNGCGSSDLSEADESCDLTYDGDCSSAQPEELEEEGYELTSSDSDSSLAAALDPGGPSACHNDDCLCHRLDNGEGYADPELLAIALERGDLDDLLSSEVSGQITRLVPQVSLASAQLQLDVLSLQADLLRSGVSLQAVTAGGALGEGCGILRIEGFSEACPY